MENEERIKRGRMNTSFLVAEIRAQIGMPYARYFTSFMGKMPYLIGRLMGIGKEDQRAHIQKRADLVKSFRKALIKYQPDQVIDLGAGGSTYGLEWARNNPDGTYVEIDLPEVCEWKKRKIESTEGILKCSNHHIVPVNLLSDDLYSQVSPYLENGKRTMVIAEGLTVHLDPNEHNILTKNVQNCLRNLGGGLYVSHDINLQRFMDLPKGERVLNLFGFLFKGRLKGHFDEQTPFEYFSKRGFTGIRQASEYRGLENRIDDNEVYPTYWMEVNA
ncbi:class I SAM-dependent methyltransferase [Candidatus Pacearchaeota archaeon]|nr:class I SAM-dependent methyltransferase [Candidatus Pacearchaeota archaeon]